MKTNYPNDWLRSNPNYEPAQEVLKAILIHEKPDKNDLIKIFGKLAPMIEDQIEKHYSEFPLIKTKVRLHTKFPTRISESRLKLENDLKFAKMHLKILNNEIPDIDEIEPFFGNYAKIAQDILKLYKKYNLKRKCGVPSAAHPSRVAGIVDVLEFDAIGSFKFTTVAFLHDSIEDLVKFEKRPSDHHGLGNLERFIDTYIPEELRPNIKLLTNHYSLILNYLDYLINLTDKKVNGKNLNKEIINLCSWEWSLKDNVNKLQELLAKKESVIKNINDAKWECYKDLYIKEMAENAKEVSDFRTFEIKGIDLSDNSHSSAALSMSERLRNIQKQEIWANEGYCLNSDWEPTNNFIQEVFEDALVYSEQIVIKDFLVPVLKPDFFASALYKIEELKNIFYVD